MASEIERLTEAEDWPTARHAIRAPEKPFTFSYELVRQTLLAGISAPRRQLLHAGVADAIAQL